MILIPSHPEGTPPQPGMVVLDRYGAFMQRHYLTD